MTPDSQVLLSVGIPTIAILVSIIINNRQVESLRSEMRSEVGGLRSEMRSEIAGLRAEMNARFDAVNARIVGLHAEMNARFEIVEAKFESAHQSLLRVEGMMDARLRHLEER